MHFYIPFFVHVGMTFRIQTMTLTLTLTLKICLRIINLTSPAYTGVYGEVFSVNSLLCFQSTIHSFTCFLRILFFTPRCLFVNLYLHIQHISMLLINERMYICIMNNTGSQQKITMQTRLFLVNIRHI